MNRNLSLFNINTTELVSLVLLMTLIASVCLLAGLSIYRAVQRNRSEGQDCFLRYLSPTGWTSIALSVIGLFCAGCIATRAVSMDNHSISAQGLDSVRTNHHLRSSRISISKNRFYIR